MSFWDYVLNVESNESLKPGASFMSTGIRFYRSNICDTLKRSCHAYCGRVGILTFDLSSVLTSGSSFVLSVLSSAVHPWSHSLQHNKSSSCGAGVTFPLWKEIWGLKKGFQNIIVYTLTGHFIRYTLLVPGWTHFSLQNCLNSSWHRFNKVLKHSSEILVHIDMIASRSCCRFVGCTSMMWISRSTTSQSCSIGLRSGDCGGHLSKVNSLSCSRNQSEMIWALWHGAGF